MRDGPLPEKQHPPSSWSSWAVTRGQFVDLVRRLSGVIEAATGAEPQIEVEIAGFTGNFRSVDQLSIGVEDPDWLAASVAPVRVRILVAAAASGPRPLEVLAIIEPDAGQRAGRVTLNLDGGDHFRRQAVEPDVKDLMARYARPRRSERENGWRVAALIVGGYSATFGGPIALGVGLLGLAGVGERPDGEFSSLTSAVAGAVMIIVGAGLLYLTVRDERAHVELLPSSGMSPSEARSSARARRLKRIWPKIVEVATVAAAVLALAAVVLAYLQLRSS